ncbi:MAG: cysteine--tRNA ligase, partial [Treponema sp.]|nr:cysteine--tRNA ligase [Treponema sp.]
IAQSEAATGKSPCVRYWLHNEFLVMAATPDRKMSKSSGEFLTLQKIVDSGYHPLDYRYFLLGAHYRSQLQFSWNALDGARNARRSLLDRICALTAKAADGDSADENRGKADPAAAKYLEAFDAAIRGDLNTPRALAELWGLLRDASVPARAALETAFDMDGVLGLDLAAPRDSENNAGEPALTIEEQEEIGRIIAERAGAKKARDFARADALRQGLKDRGIVLEDGPDGTTWRMVSDGGSGSSHNS